MIIYLAISCITLSFCAFTYLWVSNKWERKKWEYKTVEEVALADELKSPSATASIPAATNIASVPVPSFGA